MIRGYSERVKPPRTIFLKGPFGHPFGHPHNHEQQRAVLKETLAALEGIKQPGEIIDLLF